MLDIWKLLVLLFFARHCLPLTDPAWLLWSVSYVLLDHSTICAFFGIDEQLGNFYFEVLYGPLLLGNREVKCYA